MVLLVESVFDKKLELFVERLKETTKLFEGVTEGSPGIDRSTDPPLILLLKIVYCSDSYTY